MTDVPSIEGWDGSVLLFASSAHTRAHWVFKLDPEQGTLEGMRRMKGMLGVRPSVDMGGHSFLVQKRASESEKTQSFPADEEPALGKGLHRLPSRSDRAQSAETKRLPKAPEGPSVDF